MTWDVAKSTPAGSPPVVTGWPTPPPGMGPSQGLPNRAPTGGWGIVGTAGATACRLAGCVGRVVWMRPSYAQGFDASPLLVGAVGGWLPSANKRLREPVETKFSGRSGA